MSDPLTGQDLGNLLDNLNLENVDTEYPVLKPGLYRMRIESIEAQLNKAETAHNLVVKLVLSQDNCQSDANEPISPGYKLTYYIGLKENPEKGYDPRKNLAQLQEAATGTKGQWNPAELIGREVFAKLVIEDNDTYGKSNKVSYLKSLPATSEL